MQLYNNVLAIESRWLINEDIISESNYHKMAERGHFNILRRGCRNSPALVSYESFPQDLKLDVIRKLDNRNPYDIVKTNLIESYIVHNTQISEFFDSHKLPDGRNLPKETRKEYYNNAIVLEAVISMLQEKRAIRAKRGKKLKINWVDLAQSIQDIDRSKYPHNLPANPRSLENKYDKYRAEGQISLIHKNFLNVNAAKVDDEIKESLLIELIADSRNLDNEQVASLYNVMAVKMGWKKITGAAVAVWRDKYELEVYAGRRGSVAFSNKLAMQHKRKAPTYPLYFWTMDGWDVELLYQKTENRKTTYTHRAAVVVVLDACLKYPVGYAIGTHETPELIQQALRNASKHTAELFGKMYRTNQIQSDRYAIKKMTPYQSAIGDKVTPARAHNAKAKIIEPYFGTNLNKKYCQLLPNWSGFGITSNKEKQPNVEFLNKYKNHFPDYQGVCKQIEMIMERERVCDGKQERFLELWKQMPDEDKIELSFESYLRTFGETTGFRNRIEGSGLNITIHGEGRVYDCFDTNFRRHQSTRWEVRFDPDNLKNVLAVNEDESLQFMLEEKYVQPMALKERKEGDSEQLKRVNDYNKQLVEEITEFRANNADVLRSASLELPEFKDTLNKLLITDSLGQHKDNRNKQKMLGVARKLNDKYEEAEIIEDASDFKAERNEYLRKKVDLSKYLEIEENAL